MSRHHVRLHAARWRAVRRAVLERDGWRCVSCGRPGQLEVDHIRPLEKQPGQDPYDVNGLQSLCRNCHIEKTSRENRRELSPAEAEWRDFVRELLQ